MAARRRGKPDFLELFLLLLLLQLLLNYCCTGRILTGSYGVASGLLCWAGDRVEDRVENRFDIGTAQAELELDHQLAGAAYSAATRAVIAFAVMKVFGTPEHLRRLGRGGGGGSCRGGDVGSSCRWKQLQHQICTNKNTSMMKDVVTRLLTHWPYQFSLKNLKTLSLQVYIS